MRRALCITWGRRPRPLLLLHSSISPSNKIHRACRPKSWCRSAVPLVVNALLRPLLSSLSIRCRRNQHQQLHHRRRQCPWKATRSLNGAVRRPMQRYRCAATSVHRGCNVKTTDDATASGLDHRPPTQNRGPPFLPPPAKATKLLAPLRVRSPTPALDPHNPARASSRDECIKEARAEGGPPFCGRQKRKAPPGSSSPGRRFRLGVRAQKRPARCVCGP